MIDKLNGKEAAGMVSSIEGVFKGLPHLPKGLVDFLVSIAPWMAGLGGVLSVVGGLQMISMFGRQSSFWAMVNAYAGVNRAYFVVAGLLMILMGGLYLMAFKPLKEKVMLGWMYMFWAQVLSIASAVVAIVFGYGGIVGTIIGALIGFYVLFEVKPSYK